MPEGSSVFWRKDRKRWVLSYADPARGQPQKVLPKEITNQRAAEQWARAWLDAAGLRPTEALAQRRDEGPTVALCADRWLALLEKDSRVAPATLAGNRGHLFNHILPTFGARSIAALEVPELRSWLRALREKIKGASTVRNIYYTFSSLYAAAMAEGWVRREANVVAHPGVKKEVPELDDSKEVIRLPVAWAQTLIESPVVPLERRARYSLAFTSGMRDGEIAGARLKFLQLDADVPVLKILEAVAIIGAKGKGGFAKAKAPKTKKSKRTLPVPSGNRRGAARVARDGLDRARRSSARTGGLPVPRSQRPGSASSERRAHPRRSRRGRLADRVRGTTDRVQSDAFELLVMARRVRCSEGAHQASPRSRRARCDRSSLHQARPRAVDGGRSRDPARLDGRSWHKAFGDDRRHKQRG